MTTRLRSRDDIFLIGYPSMNITGNKLPSKKQVLRMHFFNIRKRNMSKKNSAVIVADAVMIFWRQAAIPTKARGDVTRKIAALHDEWDALRKSSHRKTESTREKEKTFSDSLDNLFDIAHANALEIMTNTEDIEFLLKQREDGRPGTMGGVDATDTRTRKRKAEREEQEELRRKRATESSRDRCAKGGKLFRALCVRPMFIFK